MDTDKNKASHLNIQLANRKVNRIPINILSFFFPEIISALFKKKPSIRTSLGIKWLRLYAPNAGARGSIPGLRELDPTRCNWDLVCLN